jgi:hypothetical protein
MHIPRTLVGLIVDRVFERLNKLCYKLAKKQPEGDLTEFIKLKIPSFVESHRDRELVRLSATFATGKWRLVSS